MEYLEIIAALGIVAYAVIEMRHGRATDREILQRVLELDWRTQLHAESIEQADSRNEQRISTLAQAMSDGGDRIARCERDIAVLQERTRASTESEDDDD
jgi:hypothetical protein